ncbi:sorting nexin-25-like [Ostrea edulis]|uniref:sorting nexin-25-like n=1 Tax=Ostrea edulis TaxID=37623 RepID=UPI00209454F2|nr:sorting nexin-25-like [Ostrea edulis]XP_048774014.1 sorting nexin-25-like [Ostrea edulis]XP_056009894.1 sorting nexin-25-like [Ostrea edulis]XP_056009895.1 sorting nexin-25-like [Ostrea edulis]
MIPTRYIFLGCGMSLLAIGYHYEVIGTFLSLLVHCVLAVLGVYFGVSWSLVQGKMYKPTSQPRESKMAQELIKFMEKRYEKKLETKKVVITRNVDGALQEVLDLIMRDYIMSWYSDLSKDHDVFLSSLRSDMWIMIESLTNRLKRMDKMKFITEDVVLKIHKHFQEVREYRRREDDKIAKKFILQPWLENDETETEFLRKVCEFLLMSVLPKEYTHCHTLRRMLREIMTSSALKPSIDMLCDPDYINQKLINYIDYRQQLSEDTRKKYTYAATYEEFVKLIDKCEDIEHLKQIRYNVMMEIIHATTIQNIKKEQNIPGEKGPPRAMGKGDLLKARNLKRYINQLTIAKAHSEKRIHGLGGPDYKSYETTEDSERTVTNSTKILTFEEVMESADVRMEFFKYLEKDDNHSLLGFCIAVERLQTAEKRKQYQLGKEIYDKYIASSTSAVKLERGTKKEMEAFLLGNSPGHEAFESGQKTVLDLLKKQYYPSFLVSDIYHRYLNSLEQEASVGHTEQRKDEFFFQPDSDDEDEDMDFNNEDSIIFKDQSYFAQQKLEQLDGKIQMKTHALKAHQESRKMDDSKAKKVEKDLEVELDQLILQRRQLEIHILRTQKWCENQGSWRAMVYEAQIVEEEDKRIPTFVLIVHLAGKEKSHNLQHSAEGWLVTRNIPDFNRLHEKMIEIGPWLKKKELPSVRRFTTLNENFLSECKRMLNEYLSAIMKDSMMAQSEALYGFLTPTPEFFWHRKPEKKKEFFITSIIKSLPIGQYKQESADELKLVEEEDDGSKLDRKDSIAEPFYRLVDEVFECHGMFKWLRRSFIMFVEVTFGRSINRQLRETVDWVFSESMIIYYVTLFKNSMWPNGKLAESPPPKTDIQKLQTRLEAKEKFLNNIPDAVRTLLGEENGRRGAIKMFEVLQDPRLNKHLFYGLLEVFLLELYPELKESPESRD